MSISTVSTRKLKKDDQGGGVFLAWCVLLVACYSVLLAGSLPSFPLGGPGDFLVAYSAAKIVRDGHGSRLYDLGLQTEVQEDILAAYNSGLSRGPLPYLHPPFYAAMFVPFTFLSARAACYLWVLVNLAILVACVHLLWRGMKANSECQFSALLLMVLAFYPVFETLRKGQSSFLLLLSISLTYWGLTRGSIVLAGAALGAALMKPHIAVVFAAMLLYKKQWRPFLGFCAAAIALTAGSWFLVGTDGLVAYVNLTRDALTWNGTHHVYPEAMPTLRGLALRVTHISGLAGQEWPVTAARAAITLMASLVILGLTVRTWRGSWEAARVPFDLRFTQLILASILMSPYLYWHDLSLLVLPGVLVFGYLRRGGSAGLGYAILAMVHLCAIPVSTFLIGVDLSAPIVVFSLVCLMGFVMRQVKRAGA